MTRRLPQSTQSTQKVLLIFSAVSACSAVIVVIRGYQPLRGYDRRFGLPVFFPALGLFFRERRGFDPTVRCLDPVTGTSVVRSLEKCSLTQSGSHVDVEASTPP